MQANDTANRENSSTGRSTRRRAIAGAGAAGIGVAGVLAAACGPQGGQAGPGSTQGKVAGKVVFMSQGTDPNDEQRYKPLVEQFNAKGGPVTIDLIQGDAGGSAVNAQGKLIALAAAGTAPDVFWTHAYITPNLIKLSMLTDVSPFIKKDRDFKLTSYFEAPLKDYEADGKQYGLPREATTTLLVINKELFQKNGVALPTPNWTWDDYLKAAQQLSKGSGAQQTWGAAGFVGTGSYGVYISYPRVWQEGGDIVDKTRTKFTLHQAPAVDQMQWIADLVRKHRVHPFGDEFPGATAREVWSSGRIGMMASLSVYTNYSQAQFDWDVAHIPRGKTRATRTASAGHSVTAASKSKDAAWEVLKYLGSKPAYEHWAKLGLTLPTYKEVANSPLVLKPDQPPKSAKIALDAFEYARPEPISGDWGNVNSEISKAMSEAYAGKTDAKGALSGIVQIVESLLAKTPAKS
ncbi:MAG: sugar ABC transporter substrate-binding protein [Chloroflexi bacterium]|nr:sugar ABC transporter substrate-binding protein [Chloroflexota bacterium]